MRGNYKELRQEVNKAIQAIEMECAERVRELLDPYIGQHLSFSSTVEARKITDIEVSLSKVKDVKITLSDGYSITL